MMFTGYFHRWRLPPLGLVSDITRNVDMRGGWSSTVLSNWKTNYLSVCLKLLEEEENSHSERNHNFTLLSKDVKQAGTGDVSWNINFVKLTKDTSIKCVAALWIHRTLPLNVHVFPWDVSCVVSLTQNTHDAISICKDECMQSKTQIFPCLSFSLPPLTSFPPSERRPSYIFSQISIIYHHFHRCN